MLLADWFARLARESGLDLAEQHGTSGQSFILGVANAFHVTAHFTEASPFLNFIASDPAQQSTVDSIVAQAVGRVERSDFGGPVWYSTELHEDALVLSPVLMGSFFQRLGSQTRIAGWRRLGPSIILEFIEELADWDPAKALFSPKAVVHVRIAAPGPCVGIFSSYVAHGAVETVVSICTFALGRSVALPAAVFPSKSEELPQLATRKNDPEVLTLARKHIPLDIFSLVAIPGGDEVFARSRAALITFDAAVRQERDSVACILYVAAAECLTTPNTNWRATRLTKRFVEFFDELMPTELDQIVAHANFEEAFGIRRGTRTARALRRDLLSDIYDYRSGLLHEGLRPSYSGLGVGLDMSAPIRRGLFADFAEGAMLRYLAAPRVSLIGHPSFGRDTQACDHLI